MNIIEWLATAGKLRAVCWHLKSDARQLVRIVEETEELELVLEYQEEDGEWTRGRAKWEVSTFLAAFEPVR